MMSALGWQGMQNKRLAITALLLAAATVVFAQENTASGTASKGVAPSGNQGSESSSGNYDRGVVDQDPKGSSENKDVPANGVIATPPPEGDAPGNASAANAAPKRNESITATDDYRATERISEDRSVSFPVDI